CPCDDTLKVADLLHLQQDGTVRHQRHWARKVLPITSKASEDDPRALRASQCDRLAAGVANEVCAGLRDDLERWRSLVERESEGIIGHCGGRDRRRTAHRSGGGRWECR